MLAARPMGVTGLSVGMMQWMRNPKPSFCAAAATYSARNQFIRFAPAYPPLKGEPWRAAALEVTMKWLPGGAGNRSAFRSHAKVPFVSTNQFAEKVSQVWR